MAELVRAGAVPAAAQTINLAGEALSGRLVTHVYESGRVQQVWNLYGPSEDTTYSTYARCRAGAEPRIGRPVDNTQAYVVDGAGAVVAVGVEGEIWLGGEGLARGYFGRAAQTAERFIPDGLSGVAGGRLYRTGDVGRYSASGELEYVGRRDQQVKVRGYRIELGEIEAVLKHHPAVAEAAVVVRAARSGEPEIVGYLVWQAGQMGGQTGDIGELRRYLREQVPGYMVPAQLMVLAELPQTPNGKLDRRALPAPPLPGAAATEVTQARARTPVEEVLREIWCEVLGAEQLSVEANFFDLGGHSLLATQVMSRAEKVFGVRLELRQLFEQPTVRGLGQEIERRQQERHGIEREAVELKRREGVASEAVPLSYGQQRLWFLDRLVPNSPVYNIPIAIHFRGPLRIEALSHSFNEITRRHEILRANLYEIDEQPLQRIRPVQLCDLPVIELDYLSEQEQERQSKALVAAEARRPFNLQRGPLLRQTLFKFGADDYVLLMVVHHIVFDEWSTKILVDELTKLSGAFIAGKPSPLPELDLQYTDFAHWQRQWLTGEALTASLTYWQQQLMGAADVLALPADHPRPPVHTLNGRQRTFLLSESLTRAINTTSRQEGVSEFMLLLAVFKCLLFRYSGQEDLCVGVPIANRNNLETEGIIGFFTNTLVLRSNLRGQMLFRELLADIRQTSLEAYAHQELPFEKLVEVIEPERTLSHEPLIQVMFVMQNLSIERIEFAAGEGILEEIENGTSRFDLTLYVRQTENGLRASFQYNSDLFDASTITRLGHHWQQLLTAIIDAPATRLSDLRLLTAGEQQQLLVEWNDTSRRYPQHRSLAELFAAQVARTPDALALLALSSISRINNWSNALTNSRSICVAAASAPNKEWDCVWSARWRWWWGCWGS